jgi:hypothetical protein
MHCQFFVFIHTKCFDALYAVTYTASYVTETEGTTAGQLNSNVEPYFSELFKTEDFFLLTYFHSFIFITLTL